MCNLKSGIVLKDRVYVPDHDHHTDMLEELGIEDSQRNAESLFVRVELLPPNGDVFADVETWKLSVDQDIKPDWFFEEIELPKIRAAVKAWASEHIFVGKDALRLDCKENRSFYFKDCHDVELISYGASTINAESYGTSTINARSREASTINARSREASTINARSYGASTINAESYGASTINAESYGTSTINAESYGASTINAWSYGTSTINARSYETSTINAWSYGTSTINARSYGASTINAESREASTIIGLCGVKPNICCICDNSTFKDCQTKTIYQSGDWKLVAVGAEDVQ